MLSNGTVKGEGDPELSNVAQAFWKHPSSALHLLTKWHPELGRHVLMPQVLAVGWVQTVGVPGWHVPPAHVSLSVQKLPSWHGVPLSGACWQPLAEAQLSAVHTSPSSQDAAPIPMHMPVAHASPVVHGLPSSQAPPVAGAHAVGWAAGWQLWHTSATLVSPAARQFPPIRQVPGAIG